MKSSWRNHHASSRPFSHVCCFLLSRAIKHFISWKNLNVGHGIMYSISTCSISSISGLVYLLYKQRVLPCAGLAVLEPSSFLQPLQLEERMHYSSSNLLFLHRSNYTNRLEPDEGEFANCMAFPKGVILQRVNAGSWLIAQGGSKRRHTEIDEMILGVTFKCKVAGRQQMIKLLKASSIFIALVCGVYL